MNRSIAAVFCVLAIGAGWILGRDWLQGRLIAMLNDPKYAVMPESPEFSQPLELTFSEPILTPEALGYYDPAGASPQD